MHLLLFPNHELVVHKLRLSVMSMITISRALYVVAVLVTFVSPLEIKGEPLGADDSGGPNNLCIQRVMYNSSVHRRMQDPYLYTTSSIPKWSVSLSTDGQARI